jgi:hypothetical protein
MLNLIKSKTSATKIAEECVQLFFLILLLVVSLPVNSQTYLDKLDSIEQKLDDIEFDRNIERMRRQYDQIDRDMERIRQQRLQRNELPQPYQNTETQEQRIENAKFWNLSLSEYLRRDEVGSIECTKYVGELNASTIGQYITCRNSKLLNISYAETEMRQRRINENCTSSVSDISLPDPKIMECAKRYMVLAKETNIPININVDNGTNTDIFGWLILIIIGSAIGWWIYHLTSNAKSEATAKEDVKKIFPCPKCVQQCRVPAFKEIEVTCPRCKHIWKLKT